jgi:hypothetical protein
MGNVTVQPSTLNGVLRHALVLDSRDFVRVRDVLGPWDEKLFRFVGLLFSPWITFTFLQIGVTICRLPQTMAKYADNSRTFSAARKV